MWCTTVVITQTAPTTMLPGDIVVGVERWVFHWASFLLLIPLYTVHCSTKYTISNILSVTTVHYLGSASRIVRDSVDAILSASEEQKINTNSSLQSGPQGFSGDGFFCRSSVSCRADPSVCHPQASCDHDPASPFGVSCRCRAGFTGDGYNCIGEAGSCLLIFL